MTAMTGRDSNGLERSMKVNEEGGLLSSPGEFTVSAYMEPRLPVGAVAAPGLTLAAGVATTVYTFTEDDVGFAYILNTGATNDCWICFDTAANPITPATGHIIRLTALAGTSISLSVACRMPGVRLRAISASGTTIQISTLRRDTI
jgi:hypothetical protein